MSCSDSSRDNSFRPKVETKLFPRSANAVVETQKFYARDRGAHGQCRCQVNRVKRPDWFGGKRMPCTFHNVGTDSPQVPVASGSIQVGSAVRSRSFIDFSCRDGANQHPITLNQRKIGGCYEFGAAKHLAHRECRIFAEQPR
jgi:hypothetical protein